MNDIAVSLGGYHYRVQARRPSVVKFWRSAEAGRWEDETLRFLDTVANRDTVLVDIGAWVGPIALYASPRVAKVIAIEPDPVAFRELEANTTANTTNVEIWHAAVDVQAGTLSLHAPDGLGDSVTSSFGAGTGIAVRAITFDDIEARIPPAANVVLKVDIEGHEYHVINPLLALAKRRQAAMHLSLHPRAVWAAGSRIKALSATIAVVRRMEELGPVVLSKSGQRASLWTLIRQIALKWRPKNFSVEVRPQARPSP